MNQLEGGENVCSSKQTLGLDRDRSEEAKTKSKSIIINAIRLQRTDFGDIYNKLRIKVVPMFSRYESCRRVKIDLISLLEECDDAEQDHKAVQCVPHEIDKVPHISQIATNAFAKDLLSLFPDESDDVDDDENFEWGRRVATLLLQRFSERSFHALRSEQQHGLHLRSLTHQNQDNCCASRQKRESLQRFG